MAFGFAGAAGGASDALQQILARAFAEKQAQEEMALRQRADTRAGESLKLQQSQEARVAEIQRQQAADLEKERAFRKATTIANAAMPNDLADPETAALLREQGYGSQIQETPRQGAYLGDDEQSVPRYEVIPELRMRGGSQYLNAQAQREAAAANAAANREATAANAEANRRSAEERAAADRETRAMIAGMANQGRSETTALRNDLLRTQVDAATQKAEDKKAADKRAKDAARVTSQATIDVLEQLATFDPTGKATLKPGVSNLFGMRNPLAQLVPGSDTSNAKAALNRLKGRAIVDLLNEMKNQSATGATGFGALSGPELKLLQNASTQLDDPNIGDVRAAEELSRIYNMARQLYTGSSGAPPGGDSGVQRWGRDAQGRPVRLP